MYVYLYFNGQQNVYSIYFGPQMKQFFKTTDLLHYNIKIFYDIKITVF